MSESRGKPAAADPRQKYLDAALPLFAARGLHGTSIAAVAEALGLTKQAMLHHFGSKERLYAAVLDSAVDHIYRTVSVSGEQAVPEAARLEVALAALVAELRARPALARLMIREMLENGPWLAGPGGRRLRLLFDHLGELASEAPHWRRAPARAARAGALLAFAAQALVAGSRPALASLWGEDVPDDIEAHVGREIAQMIAAPGVPKG